MQLTPCKCSICEIEAMSVKGTQHRRCMGSESKGNVRDKRDKLPSAKRGKWE